MANGPIAADDLRLGIERIERLEEEKKGISDDIKDVYGEYKSKGFCPKTMKRIVALRKLTPDDRREAEAMLDLYKGALGMLDGTPLGTWAVEKLKKEEPPKADGEPAPDGTTPPAEAEPEEPAAPPPPELTVDDARQLGSEAARGGKAVTANPFPPRDPRRAAWDEAWCRELGSDGMDIPEVLRPTKATKPGAPASPEEPAASAGEPVAPEPKGKKK